MPWDGSPQPWPQADCGNSPGTAARAPLGDNGCRLLSGKGHPVYFVRIGEACGAAGVASRQPLRLVMGRARKGGMDIIPSGWQEKVHSCLAAGGKAL